MKTLVFDTETTGFPIPSAPIAAKSQPHVVELAAVLVDDAFKVVASMHHTIRPEGWVIPVEVSRIHGITTAIALERGNPARAVLREFVALVDEADAICAHNKKFDLAMMRTMYARHAPPGSRSFEQVMGKEQICTAELSADILRLPPTEAMRKAGRTHYKTPKLAEAYEALLGTPLKDAHTALADCYACVEVLRVLKQREAAQAVS